MRDLGLGFALILGGFAAFGPAACTVAEFNGNSSTGGEGGTGTGSTNGAGTGGGSSGEDGSGEDGSGEAGSGEAGSGEAGSGEDGGASHGPVGGLAGQPALAMCKLDTDCASASSDCSSIACVDGACVEAALTAGTACEGGTCDGQGECATSSCESGERDGDETGTDCGGSCGLCDDGEGCAQGSDCRSGVCTNAKCLPSGCTDGVANGTETDVDCGGTCALKCNSGQGCAAAADCAITPGLGAESVRCLEQLCTNTKPPAEGLRYWQDFETARLAKLPDETSCHATDDNCLYGNGAAYQMWGVTPDGKTVALTKAKLFTTAGAVGGGGKFDGTYCLTRERSNLAMHNAGALSAMAWVKPTRSSAPWEGVIFGGLNHHMMAVDSFATSQRFLAAVATTQSTSFAYRSSVGNNEVVTGEWHHVAFTYDSGAGALVQYVDGAEVQTTTITGNITSDLVDVFMGCRKATKLEQFFIGTLDEVVLYTRALSAEELADYVRRSTP